MNKIKEEIFIETKEIKKLNNDNLIALKSGYYFMIFKKEEIPFFDGLNKTDIVVSKENKEYHLYEASTWELAQKVDNLMGNENLGFDIDDYIIKI